MNAQNEYSGDSNLRKKGKKNKCNHGAFSNVIKAYITFENTGVDHETHYISGIRCPHCELICSFYVDQWEYSYEVNTNNEENEEKQGLTFSISPISIREAKRRGYKELMYRHYPARLISMLTSEDNSTKKHSKVQEIIDLISKIMPSRLSRWVLGGFVRGNDYDSDTEIPDVKDFVNRYWKSLTGYARKILTNEKPPVWA